MKWLGALAALAVTSGCPAPRHCPIPEITTELAAADRPPRRARVPVLPPPLVRPPERPQKRFPTPGPLAKRVSSKEVSIAPSLTGTEQHPHALLYLAAAPDGGVRVAWIDDADTHVRTLDKSFGRVGNDLIVRGWTAVQLASAPDGGLLMAGVRSQKGLANPTKTDLALELIRYGSDGKQRFRTTLVGGGGTGPEARWHAWTPSHGVALASHGDHHAAYIKISRNFGNVGTHQGDLFVVVDDEGQRVPERTAEWIASQSNQLFALAGREGDWLTLTVGDASPLGLYFINHTQNARKIVWPPKDLGVKKSDVTTPLGVGHLCGVARVDDRIFAAAGSTRAGYVDFATQAADVLLLGFDERGGSLSTRWVTDTPDVAEECPHLQALGDGLLVAWTTAPAPSARAGRALVPTATLMSLDERGGRQDGPVATRFPLRADSPSVALDDGSVVWAYAPHRADKISLFRVKP